jgi:putative DNA primase/helicase
MILKPEHYRQLTEGSAIAPSLIQQRGYQSFPQPEDLIDCGFSKAQAKTAPALGIPLWDVHGQRCGWQIRPDCPRQMKDGKVFKYERPKGSTNILDVHPGVQPLLGDPSVPLWIVEGVKKGDALASKGACALALVGGVWGFRGTNEHGGKVILPDWEHVALNGRQVYIAYDSDLATKRGVNDALQALWQFLRSRQALPSRVHWPETMQQTKVGVDDFFAQGHTLEDLLALIPPVGPLPATPPLRTPTNTAAVDPAAHLGTVSPCTHVANSKRLIERYQPTLRYVVGIGWILWTGQFWRPDPTSESALATGFVSNLALAIAEEASALYAAAAKTPTAEDRKALYALAQERGRWAVQSEQKGTIAAGLTLAKNGLLLEHAKINTDPWLFNCQNGTIDLRTGQLKPHDPADLITHLAPVMHDPTATCPTWERFLNEVFAGDATMVQFIQRAIGWCLTGVVQERALFLLYGAQGHNGKTTLVEVVRDLLGTSGEESFGYARKVDVMTFMKSKNYEDNLRKAAQLAGARFVYSSEIAEEHRLNEQLIKDMTGGDTLEARRLYREAFNFKPTFKPWMYGNHKPEIRGTDDALWSRVKLVEFPVSFADRVNHDLPSTLRKELSGILNWALAGCLAWQREGLQPPDKVQAATEAYRKEQDTIGQFISERCQTGEEYMKCKASALYAAYRKWTEANDHPTLSQTRFGTYLTTHGYPSDNNATGRGALRCNIALFSAPEDKDEEEEAWNATLRHGSATPCHEGVAASNTSKDTGKPQLREQDATPSTPTLRKSPRSNFVEDFPGIRGRRGSNSSLNENDVIEMEGDSDATCQNARGSSFLGSDGATRPRHPSKLAEACPQCHCTHLLVLSGAYRRCALCPWKGKLPGAEKDGVLL